MTLRQRILLIIGATLVASIVGLYAIASTVFLRGFARLEEQDLQWSVKRALNGFADELNWLSSKAADWSVWNSSYAFTGATQEAFVRNNVNASSFLELRLNLMVFLNRSGQVVYSKGFDLEQRTEMPVPASFLKLLTPDCPLLKQTDPLSARSGLVMLPEGPLLAVARPILTNDRQNRMRGTLVFARYLDAPLIHQVSQETQLQLAVRRINEAQLPADFAAAREGLPNHPAVQVRPLNGDYLAGYTAWRDIYGRPGLLVRVSAPRRVFRQGQVTIGYLVSSVLIVSLLFGIVTAVLLERLVLARLSKAIADVKRIGASGDFSGRVAVRGRDELAGLAEAINRMLAALHESQTQTLAHANRLMSLDECFLSFGINPLENIDRLTALCGESLGATRAMYNRLEGDQLCTLGRWRVPADLGPKDLARGHISYDVIQQAGDEVFVVRHLPETRYAETDPNVLRYGLQTFLGKAVKLGDQAVGSLCVVFQDDRVPSAVDCRLLGITASAIAVEERRHQAQEALRASEQQLLQSQKMEAVGRLAGGVAHDFNNILTAIGGYSELLSRLPQASVTVRNYAQEIEKAASRAATLTRQLLAFSRKQVLQPKVLDLNIVVEEMDKMLRRLIGEDIELRTALTPGLGRVRADPGQIEQVLMNLAVNARDAMPNGGRFVLETANVTIGEHDLAATVVRAEADAAWPGRQLELPPGDYVRISVRDSGMGMDADVLAHLFEPFFTTKPQGQGTGLGLATCYGIVKQSGGHIQVVSEPGHGTTFEIYLPHVEDAVSASLPAGEVGAMPGGSETLLLVEDEPAVREMATLVLDELGYRVLVAGDGAEALRVLAQRNGDGIDLLITDVVMPQMGGRELASQLHVQHPDTKVLFASGYAEDNIVHHGAIQTGIAFLQKPYTPSSLARKVRELLDS